MAQLAAFWAKLTMLVSTIRFSDIVDILIVAYLIYNVIMLIRKTNSYRLAQGVLLILIALWPYAQRSSQVLERAGITATVLKAPQSVSKTGCTYCVKLYESRLVRALALLDRAAIQRGKVYRLLKDGTYQEVTV